MVAGKGNADIGVIGERYIRAVEFHLVRAAAAIGDVEAVLEQQGGLRGDPVRADPADLPIGIEDRGRGRIAILLEQDIIVAQVAGGRAGLHDDLRRVQRAAGIGVGCGCDGIALRHGAAIREAEIQRHDVGGARVQAEHRKIQCGGSAIPIAARNEIGRRIGCREWARDGSGFRRHRELDAGQRLRPGDTDADDGDEGRGARILARDGNGIARLRQGWRAAGAHHSRKCRSTLCESHDVPPVSMFSSGIMRGPNLALQGNCSEERLVAPERWRSVGFQALFKRSSCVTWKTVRRGKPAAHRHAPRHRAASPPSAPARHA